MDNNDEFREYNWVDIACPDSGQNKNVGKLLPFVSADFLFLNIESSVPPEHGRMDWQRLLAVIKIEVEWRRHGIGLICNFALMVNERCIAVEFIPKPNIEHSTGKIRIE